MTDDELVLEGELLDADYDDRKRQKHLKDTLAYKVFELRLTGRNQTEIAQLLGITQRRVSTLLKRHITRKEKPQDVAHLRAVERARLNRWLLKLADGIEDGHPLSIQTAVRISESLRKLDNIDATPRPEGEQTTPESNELMEMITRAKAKIEQQRHEKQPETDLERANKPTRGTP